MLAVLIVAPAVQATTLLPASLFAQRDQVWGPKISPDGTRLAVLERQGDDDVIARYRLEQDRLVLEGTVSSGSTTDYFRVRWAGNERLLVSSLVRRNGEDAGSAPLKRRLVSMNVDGSDPVVLLENTRNRKSRFSGDGIVHMLPKDPSRVLIRLVDIGNDNDSSVYRLNIYSGERELVEEAARGQDIYSWFADWDGILRYAFGSDNRNRPIMLVRRADGEWYPLHKYELFADGRFFPMGFSHDDNIIYVMSSHVTGRASLYKFDLRTGDLAGKVFGHDDVDLGSLVISEAERKAVAVSYVVDQKEFHYLDLSYEALRTKLDQALPGKVNAVVSNTPDEAKLVVFSSSPTDPGTYYIFDTGTEQLIEIGTRFKGFDPSDLAPMSRITYSARDSLEIPAYVTLPRGHVSDGSAPAVVLPHGGPRTRDVLAFDQWAQFLANRGYVVLQPNFRGSRGYGERFEHLGHGTWGRAMQDDLTDGAKWLVDQGLADPDRICIAGGSYGGYAAVMGVIRAPGVFQCAASINGVSDIRRMMREDGDYDSRNSEFKRVAGALTKGELDLISPIDRADEINVPVLLVHGAEDRNVSIKHSRQLANKLSRLGKPNTFIPVRGEGHSFRRADSNEIWLTALEKFLEENIGPGVRLPPSTTDMTSLEN